MVNFHQSVSETIPLWSKRSVFFLVFSLVFFSTTLTAQRSELDKFNNLFFEAEKQKSLGNSEKAKKIYLQLYDITDTNSTVAYELGIIYLGEENRDSTLFFAEKATELNPGNKWFSLLLSSAYQQFGLWEKQIEILKELKKKFPENPDYIFELAIAYLETDDPKKAIAELDKLEKLIGINEIVTDQKKQIYLQQGDLKSTLKEQQQLIDAFPTQLEYYGQLAQLYDANGYEEEAYETYQRMLEVAPDDPRPHLDLAQYYRTHKEYKKSLHHLKIAMASPDLDIDQKMPVLLSLFDAAQLDTALSKEAYQILEDVIKSDPKEPKAYAIYGDFLNRDGKGREALEAYRKATRLEGGDKFLIWEQILLLEIQFEMYDTLVKDGPEAVELFPNQPLPYFFTGVALASQENYTEAIQYLEDGLNFVIGNPQLKEQFYLQLADSHHRLEQHEKSDQFFDKALLINNRNPTTLNNYAYYLSVRGTKLDKALTMTEKSNTLSPANPTFLDTWAWVLFQRGEYQQALEKMESVIQLGGGNNGEVLEHYGDILFQNGMVEKALEQWKRAKELGGTSLEIDQKIKNQSL